MSGRIVAIIALIGIGVFVIGLFSLSGCINGDISNLAQCQSDLLLTIVGAMITVAAGGGGAAAS